MPRSKSASKLTERFISRMPAPTLAVDSNSTGRPKFRASPSWSALSVEAELSSCSATCPAAGHDASLSVPLPNYR